MNNSFCNKYSRHILLIFLSLFLYLNVSAQCTYSICLYDTYGDGWNGGTITSVVVNGSTVLSNLTIASGSGPECHDFTVNDGQTIVVNYTGGSWTSENYYNIYIGSGGTGSQIYTSGSGSTPPTTYSLNAGTPCSSGPPPPPVPANDEPCNAIAITPGTSCSFTTYTNTNATASAGAPAPGCASYSTGDVWFSVVVPASGQLIFDSQTGDISDGGMAIYSGTCNSLTLIECDDDDSNNGMMSMINNATLTPGSTVFIRMWEYGGDIFGTFGLCVYEPVPSCTDGIQNQGETGIDCGGPCPACPVLPSCVGNPPAGNTACTATPICDLNGYCGSTAATYTADYWSELGTAFCGSIENNSFISFTASSSTISFNVWVTSTTMGYGIQIFIYSAASCSSGAVTGYTCWNPGIVPVGPTTVSATGLTPGATYYIMIDGNAGDVCNYIIGANSGIQIPVDVTPLTSTICLGQSVTLTASGGNGTYTWSPSAGLSATTGTTVTATPTSVGTFSYTVTSTTGNPLCPLSTTATATITVNGCGCVVTAGNSGPVCASGTFDLTASTVTGATSYSWSGPSGYTSTTQNPTGITAPSTAGTYDYTVTVTTATSTCTSTTTLTVNPIPTVTVPSNIAVCNGATIAATSFTSTPAGATFTWTNSNTAIGIAATGTGDIPSFTATNTGTTPITATISVTSVLSGCTGTASTYTITVNPTPTVTVSSNSPICTGQNLNLTSLPAGGTNYSWTGPDGFTSLVQNPTITSAAATATGTYYVTVTLTGGCTGTGQTDVTVNANPSATASSNSPVCAGQSLNLTSLPAGGTNYTWSGPNGFTSSVQNPTISSPTAAASGTYYVTVTFPGGCIGTGQTDVTVNANPIVSASSNSPICTPQDLNLTSLPAGGTNYNWTGPNGFTSTVQNPTITGATPAATGTYYVTVTFTGGCTGTGQTTTVVNAIPTVTTGNNSPICAGQNLNLTSLPSGGTNYNWTGPNGFTSSAQNPTITAATINATGTYYVTVTLAGGCTGTGQTIATINDNPTVTVSSNSPICEGINLSLTSLPAGGISYTWTGPNNFTSSAQNPTINAALPNATGSYSVVVVDNNGCTGTSSLNAIINPIPTSNFTATPVACTGNVNITYMGSGNSSATYTWNFGTATIVSGSNQGPYVINYATDGTYTVSLQVTQNGCMSSITSQNIFIAPPLTLGLTQYDVTCYGSNNGAVTSVVGGGTQPYNYLWSNGSVFSAIPNATAGTYTLTVTDNSGCQIIDDIVVYEPPKLAIDVPSFVAICNDSAVTILASVTGGTFPYTLLWNTGYTTPSITVSPDTTTHYYVTATDANGCTSMSDIEVFVFPPLIFTASSSADSICLGEEVIFVSTVSGGNNGPYSYYVNGALVEFPYYLYPNVSQSYQIEVSDGCQYSAQVFIPIYVYPSPAISPSSDFSDGCIPFAVQFNESSPNEGQTYLWEFGDSESAFIKNPLHVFTQPGSYDVSLTITNIYGCTINHFYPDWITVYPLPEAQFESNPHFASLVKPIISFTNYSTLASSVMWHFGDGDSSNVFSPTHIYPSTPTGIYEVTLIVFTNNGCTDTITGTVEIKDEFTFYAPTAFSPDNDGNNEIFFVTGSGIKEETFHMIVYDRWGEEIFESTEMANGWDGRVKGGDKAPNGVYTWIATFRDYKKILHEKSGAITLIR